MTEEKWNWKEAARRVEELIDFPLEEKPKLSIDRFPEDITLIPSDQVGFLMGQLEAWRSYIASQLMVVLAKHGIVKNSFELGLGKSLFKMEEELPKRRLKEGLISHIITNSEELRKAKIMLIEFEAKIMILEKAYELYSNKISTLSREITRRSIGSKQEGRM